MSTWLQQQKGKITIVVGILFPEKYAGILFPEKNKGNTGS
jgi:hypothetical protein